MLCEYLKYHNKSLWLKALIFFSFNDFNSAESEKVNGFTEHHNGDEESRNYYLSDQKQLLRLSECIKHLSECYVEVCPNQDVGYKILQTAMQSEVVFLSTNY